MKLMRLAVVGAVAAIFATSPAWASLGRHSDNTTNPCHKCHDTAKGNATLRGWAGGSVPNYGTAVTGKWATRTISSLCYHCHDSTGGGLSATNQSANAYNDLAHGPNLATYPENPAGTADAAGASSGLPYMTKSNMECTSCHNVHKYEDKPFIQAATVAALCVKCHSGRANTTGRGLANSVNGLSTHPSGVTYAATARIGVKGLTNASPGVAVAYTPTGLYALGGHLVGGATTGVMDCGTCHAVHGRQQGTTYGPVNDLLAIENSTGTSGSLLCETCHTGGYAGGYVGILGNSTDHPIDNRNVTSFFPAGTVFPPAFWNKTNDRGAQPLYSGTNAPTCSSCHNTHGGIENTWLLQGPQSSGAAMTAFSYQSWCWACHPASAISPKGHHSNQLNWASSQAACGDCHGADGSDNWTAHNGFWGFGTLSVSTTNSALCEGCHEPLDPTNLKSAGLKGVANSFANSDTDMPSKHGTYRSSNTSFDNQSSHQVDLAPNATNTNMVIKTSTWASGGTSEWGTGNAPICESCHNILINGAGTASANTTSGWAANLLLEAYEDDTSGVGQTGSAVNDGFCRGCHTNGQPDGFVHNPEAHTILNARDGLAVYTLANVAYGRTTLTLLTTGNAQGACPNATTADGWTGNLSYPAANRINCDSCHRPHNADANSLDGNRYLILEITDANAWGTTICAECHNTDLQCQ